MPVFNNILAGASGQSTGYDIDQSLRISLDNDNYLSRTFSTGNRKTWTASFWLKNSDLGVSKEFISVYEDSSNRCTLGITSDKFYYYDRSGGADKAEIYSDMLVRDPSAWYQIVLVHDSTESLAGDRFKVFVNGTQQNLTTTTAIALNQDGMVNKAVLHRIGQYAGSSVAAMGGYLAEFHFIDGTALDASSFGQTDAATNQWKPIEVTGSYGTNGFYQKYSATELADSFTDSADHSVHTVTPVGTTHTDTTIKKFGTASCQLDGDSDYLSIPDSSDWDFGTGDFTLEGWIYCTDSSVTNRLFCHTAHGVSGQQGFNYYYAGDGRFTWSTNGTDEFSWTHASLAISDNTWGHIALTRTGQDLKVYANGVLKDSTTNSSLTTVYGGGEPLFIGAMNQSDTSVTGYFAGYIDEVRFSNTVRYSGAFDVATTAFTSDQYTKLLLHMDGSDGGTTFTDSSDSGGGRHTITANGDVTNTRAQYKIGDSSIKFDGTGDQLTAPSSTDWNPYGISFTAEFWLNVDSFAHTYDWLLGNTGVNNTGWNIQLASTGGKLNFLVGSGSGWDINTVSSGTGYAISTGTWYHVAVVKIGTAWTMYVDGTSRATGTSAATDYNNALQVGKSTLWSSDPRDFDGYLDEIRISNSARYTTTFTPSTTAFVADANTKLLIHSDFDGGLGADSSGNKNDFAVTNLVATDQMLDTPTNNYCTLSPIDKSGGTLLEGNLKLDASTAWIEGRSTQAVSSGKWYFEVYVVSPDAFGVGLRETGYRLFNGLYWSSSSFAASTYGTVYGYKRNGTTNYKVTNTVETSISGSVVAGDILGFEVDLDSATTTLKWNLNGVAQTTLFSSLSALEYAIGWESYNSDLIFNFGQDSSFAGNETAQGNGGDGEDFYYTPPSGFVALNTDNLSAPEIALPTDHFNTVLYTGDGAADHDITGVGFQPDFTWIKMRSSTGLNMTFDIIRGAGEYLVTNNTEEQKTDATSLLSFDSDGISVGTGWHVNSSGATFVNWNWKAGGTAASNGDGDITSSVSANPTAGFSIVSYTGTGATATVGHGLSVAPDLIIVKNRDTDATAWATYVKPLGNAKRLQLDDPYQEQATGLWDSTSPTASVFTIINDGMAGSSGEDYIAYCFNSIESYSKVGLYEGNNNADGTFIYTGFKPALLIYKSVDTAMDWGIVDDKRSPYNTLTKYLSPNGNGAEITNSFGDFTSNGVKMRNVYGGANAANTYIYYAIAESPFKTSNAR
jgi:hypothetical protein